MQQTLLGRPPLAAAVLLALTLAACTSIPDDELARLQAFERDLRDAPQVDAERAYALAEVQEIAIRRQPGLHALFHRYKAALQEIILAGALDDPQVQFGYFVEGIDDWKGGIAQTFPFWGKRGLRAEVALHEAQELRESLVEQRLAVARDAARAYWDLFYIDRARGVIARQIELLEQLAGSIEARLATGRASRADLLTVLMDLARQSTEAKNLDKHECEARGRLNALLDRGAAEPCRFSFPGAGALELSASAAIELIQRAREFGPVRVSAHRVLRRESSVSLARLGYFPDFSVGYEYIDIEQPDSPAGMPEPDKPEDPQILGVGFNLPLWWNKNKARVEQAKGLLEAERASRRQLIRDAEAAALGAISRAFEAEENRVLYEERLLPQAQERLRLSEQEYVTGRVDLDRLIDAERDVLALDLMRARAVADRESALAELDYLTAGGLGRLPRARPAGAEDTAEANALDGAPAQEEKPGVEP
ncbi:MAG: TolC family protein [Planctomycetes bacterium]|nr:TolC family protein [Planctomycetota bacterium]